MGNIGETLDSLIVIGEIYCYSGEVNRALAYLPTILKLSEEFSIPEAISLCLTNIGFAYLLKGDLNRAFDNLQSSLKICEKFENKMTIGYVFTYLGVFYHLRREFQRSLEYLERCLSISEENNDTLGVVWALYNTSRVYKSMNEWQKALDYLKRCQMMFMERRALVSNEFDLANVELGLSVTLFQLILIHLNLKEENSAKKYLSKFEQLNEKKNKQVSVRKRLAKALILKTKHRAIQKIKVQKILYQITTEEIVDHEMTIIAMFNFCELLLDEFKLYEEEEVLEEIEALLKRIYSIAQDYNSFSALVEVLILQSRFALLRGDVNQSSSLLDQAQLTSTEFGLNSLLIRVTEEQSRFQKERSKWEKNSLRGRSIADQVSQVELSEYILKARVFIERQ